ncbi:MAG: beta-N-acetylglucosaminidase domain-containing protein, partial [Myxococcota bacterium]
MPSDQHAGRPYTVNGASIEEKNEIERIAMDRGLVPYHLAGPLATIKLSPLVQWDPVITLHTPDEFKQVIQACQLPAAGGNGMYYTHSKIVPKFGADNYVHTRVDIFANDDDGRFYALKTFKQMIGYGGASILTGSILDWPATPIRGVLEGYYGTPYTPKDRLALIPLMADIKMNTYIYAPKGDPWITALWSKPFPKESVDLLRDLAKTGKENRVRICVELHPGNGVIYSSAEDMDALVAKFDVVAGLGIDCFTLAFDDSDKKLQDADKAFYQTFMEGQTDFGNRAMAALAAKYPDAMYGFVPNDYWTEAEGSATDLAYLGKNLDKRWAIAWTGNEVISKTVTVADTDYITSLLDRPPFFGDNYPVSDMPNLSGILNLGPLTGREAGVVAKTSGVVFNGMPYPYSSMIGYMSGADWGWNPDGFVPEKSSYNAAWLTLGRYARAETTEALQGLFNTNRDAFIEGSAAPDLQKAIEDFWTAFAGPSIDDAFDNLDLTLLGYTTIAKTLEENVPEYGFPIGPEIEPWITKLGQYGTTGRLALNLLGKLHYGVEKPSAEDIDKLEAQINELNTTTPKPTGKLMDDFL